MYKMKKLSILCIVFFTMQISAQDLNSMVSKGESMTSDANSSSSMIESFAGDQVKVLTKKLNLSEPQQEQVSGLVVSQLKSDKFKKLIGGLGADKLLDSGSSKKEQSKQITKALYEDPEFKKEMSSILNDEQNEKMKSL